MRLYQDLAWIWRIFSPPEVYQEEAENLLEIIENQLGRRPQNILEFGSGGGYLLSHFPKEIEKTLVDWEENMVQEAQRVNPNAHCIQGNMLDVQLEKKFDCILVHDAVMYLQSMEESQQLLKNITQHLKEGGCAILIPDATQESFYEREFLGTAEGEIEGEMVALRLMEWHWDRDAKDRKVEVEFGLFIRRNGKVEAVHETHPMLVLSFSDWLASFSKAGLKQEFPNPPWFGGGEFFLLIRD